jgi:D-threonate/D-erythronate kinase
MVVADDLSGACDTGVMFAQRGLRTVVGLQQAPDVDAEVLVVSTNSRRLSSEDAALRVDHICSRIGAGETGLIFKKIDSAARGNISSECGAMLRATHADFGVVAPALPAQGRLVKDGQLLLRDIAGSSTVDLRAVFESDGTSLQVIGESSCREELQRYFARAHRSGATYVLCDATSDDRLQLIAEAIMNSASRPLWIGSSGLAHQAAKFIGGNVAAKIPTFSGGKTLICCGSDHPVTQIQLTHLRRAVPVINLHADLVQGRDIEAALVESDFAVLELAMKEVRFGRLSWQLRAAVECGVRHILMMGGDTAELICTACETSYLILEGEVASGVAVAIAKGGVLDGVRIATKSGGFGSEDCLTEIFTRDAGQNSVPSKEQG